MDLCNKTWTLRELAYQFKKQNPDWKWKMCWNRAKKIKKSLDALNQQEYRNNKKYYKKNCELFNEDCNDDFFI